MRNSAGQLWDCSLLRLLVLVWSMLLSGRIYVTFRVRKLFTRRPHSLGVEHVWRQRILCREWSPSPHQGSAGKESSRGMKNLCYQPPRPTKRHTIKPDLSIAWARLPVNRGGICLRRLSSQRVRLRMATQILFSILLWTLSRYGASWSVMMINVFFLTSRCVFQICQLAKERKQFGCCDFWVRVVFRKAVWVTDVSTWIPFSDEASPLTLEMTTPTQVVETSVTHNSLPEDYPHPEGPNNQICQVLPVCDSLSTVVV